MWHEERLEAEWFAKLMEFDRQIAAAVAVEGCRHCGGPLHQGNYERKPRGGRIAAGEAFTLRHALCCGREGCRKRALPPSLRFLGRRVYLEAVVLLASAQAMVSAIGRVRAMTGVPTRTLRRWRSWWTEAFPRSSAWIEMRARFAPPPPDDAELPRSLLDRLASSLGAVAAVGDVLSLTACWLSPVTTASVLGGSRFVFPVLGR